MPTYTYACTDCGNRFDAVQAFTDDALTTCPKCSGRLRKLFNSVGVVFKGSGFYRTDSREQAKSSINGSAKTESTSGEQPAASKTPATSEKTAKSTENGSSTKTASATATAS